MTLSPSPLIAVRRLSPVSVRRWVRLLLWVSNRSTSVRPLCSKRSATVAPRWVISWARVSPVERSVSLTVSARLASDSTTWAPVSLMARVTSRAPAVRPSVSTAPVRSSEPAISWARLSSRAVTDWLAAVMRSLTSCEVDCRRSTRSLPRPLISSTIRSPAWPSASVIWSPLSVRREVTRSPASATASAIERLAVSRSLVMLSCAPEIANFTRSALPTTDSRWVTNSSMRERRRISLSA